MISSKLQPENNKTLGCLNAISAAALDEELMSQPGFTLSQLMELAGLAVAHVVYQIVEEQAEHRQLKRPRILLVCGPGNNGGDGLVAARHLVHFGYECVIVYPKQPKEPPKSTQHKHFINLMKQCSDLSIPILEEFPDDSFDLSDESPYEAIVDAIFGFSFKGTPREPFASILSRLKQLQTHTTIIAVDVPSGWSVNGPSKGDTGQTEYLPQVLVSLTAPKPCARHYKGRHFVGGRFLPPAMAEKYGIRTPAYPRTDQVVELQQSNDDDDWRAGYAAYCSEKEAELNELSHSGSGPVTGDDWASQYAQHCAEKEASLAANEEDSSITR